MKHKRRWTAVLVVLLAVACIGAVELTASYFFDHALYLQLTAPVRRTFHAAADACSRAASGATERLSAWWADVTAPTEEDLQAGEDQLAGDPALSRDLPILDPALTDLKIVDGNEILTGGTMEIVYFNQADGVWADQPYGTDDIGGYGCGPASMSMVVSSMTDQVVDPAEMAQWAVDHGHWARQGGSFLSIVPGIAQDFGLTASSISERTPEAIETALFSGDLLVALMGPGHFTKGGHFIVLRGVTLSGSILVADPNSRERSLMEWDAQQLLDELSSNSADGGPLWTISPAPAAESAE